MKPKKQHIYDVSIIRSEQFTIRAASISEAVDLAFEQSITDTSARAPRHPQILEHSCETDGHDVHRRRT